MGLHRTLLTCPRRCVPSPSVRLTISANLALRTFSSTTSGPLTPATVRYSRFGSHTYPASKLLAAIAAVNADVIGLVLAQDDNSPPALGLS